MADIELLPLPEWCKGCGESLPRDMQDYARANVAHATAAKDAEIERLRAEVAEWRRVASAQAELHGEAEARAERLAEALRDAAEALQVAGLPGNAKQFRSMLRGHDQRGVE